MSRLSETLVRWTTDRDAARTRVALVAAIALVVLIAARMGVIS